MTSNLEQAEGRARKRLTEEGYLITEVELSPAIREALTVRDWALLDRRIGQETAKDGSLFRSLAIYGEFTQIEHIISIRSSTSEPDEDGIWHDDGSRLLAFSLSLTLEPSTVEGGRLEIRRRADLEGASSLPTPPFGMMIVFATGHQGFEHRICRVSAGERIIIAGWCT